MPHYTTIIRWLTRTGYYLLRRSTRKICSPRKPWICIADHTIQVGTNKAFAVIGVPAETMKLGRALTLNDATVLSTTVKTSWTGTNVCGVLKKVFKHNGFPLQIVMDGASNLKKGVRDVFENMGRDCHVTYDITHLIANLFKEKYEGSMKFRGIMKELSITTKRIAQTDIGYLLPPKVREKARFLNLPNLAAWFGKLIDILKLDALTGAEKKQIKKHFGWIWQPERERYIRKFIHEVKAIKDVQKVLKNTGINEFSYKKACSKLCEIDDSNFTNPIITALSMEFDYSKGAGFPALMTSDLIESLFGKHKTITKPHRLSEINRSVLSLPVICEEISQNLIEKAFSKTTNNEVNQWVKRNIPQTLLSRKRIVMGGTNDNVTNLLKFAAKQKNAVAQPIIGQKAGGNILGKICQNASPYVQPPATWQFSG